jgi:adenylyltransferase/sulfurtransferase
VAAGFQATEAIKFLSGNIEAVTRKLHIIDVWDTSSELLTIEKGEKPCPACDEKRFDFLQGGRKGRTASLCGRNAVQILPPDKTTVDLQALRERLSVLGKVQVNNYMLAFKLEAADAYELVTFAEGRAIFKGIEDPTVAPSLYSKYIGQ